MSMEKAPNGQTPLEVINGKPVYGYNGAGLPVCYAPLRNKPGQFCMSTLCMANGRCRIHGGSSLRGAEHPNFRHGRSSDYIPAELLGDYRDFYDDPYKRDLSNELAVLDVLINTQLPRIQSGESQTRWMKAIEAWREYKRARAAHDEKKEIWWEAELDRLLDSAGGEVEARREIARLIDLRRKTSVSDTQRQKVVAEMYSIEEMMTLAKACIAAVIECVTNPHERQATIEAITRIVDRPGGGVHKAQGLLPGRVVSPEVVSDDTRL